MGIRDKKGRPKRQTVDLSQYPDLGYLPGYEGQLPRRTDRVRIYRHVAGWIIAIRTR